jgi:beta-lactam-binding protein with PASTA domain
VRRRPQLTEVPDVVGFDADDACAIVRSAGLVPCGPGKTVAPASGVVTAQRPIPGAGAERGASVVLWSGDKPDAEVLSGPSPLAPASPMAGRW